MSAILMLTLSHHISKFSKCNGPNVGFLDFVEIKILLVNQLIHVVQCKFVRSGRYSGFLDLIIVCLTTFLKTSLVFTSRSCVYVTQSPLSTLVSVENDNRWAFAFNNKNNKEGENICFHFPYHILVNSTLHPGAIILLSFLTLSGHPLFFKHSSTWNTNHTPQPPHSHGLSKCHNVFAAYQFTCSSVVSYPVLVSYSHRMSFVA